RKQVSNRGIIITPPFEFDGKMLSTTGPIDDISIRQYLLYWDKIDWPDNNIISFGGETPELLFLKEVGVIDRTRVQFSNFSGNIGYSLLLMQDAALHIRNKQQPGCWALAQPRSSLFLPSEVSEEARATEVELYSVIPVPLGTVPLEDILEFKDRRRDELLHFRSAMDELYEEVISAKDILRAKVRVIERIEQSIHDLHSVFNETWKEKLLSTVKVELNIPNLTTTAVAGAGVSAIFGFSAAAGAAIGAIAAVLKMDFGFTQRAQNLPKELKDYAYLHSIEKELKQSDAS
ncbi:MAG: DUF6236 family protein, partial [Desulfobacteraceae bacterium]|nr:DUF6236 family protein [Desulfobacteraceae bacterium]